MPNRNGPPRAILFTPRSSPPQDAAHPQSRLLPPMTERARVQSSSAGVAPRAHRPSRLPSLPRAPCCLGSGGQALKLMRSRLRRRKKRARPSPAHWDSIVMVLIFWLFSTSLVLAACGVPASGSPEGVDEGGAKTSPESGGRGGSSENLAGLCLTDLGFGRDSVQLAVFNVDEPISRSRAPTQPAGRILSALRNPLRTRGLMTEGHANNNIVTQNNNAWFTKPSSKHSESEFGEFRNAGAEDACAWHSEVRLVTQCRRDRCSSNSGA